ncbi:hypothetical protein [Lentibacillus salinarum]|uniref:Uncharacterized protein n=1 Tax=Lentibacillus salinarum TaxID=446820 RepID=A0ABW3ZXE7_9BACI
MPETKSEKNQNNNKSSDQLEKMLQTYIQVDESEQEARWLKGQVLDIILTKQPVSKKWLSSQLDVSPAQIRVLVQVYQAFPEKQSRIQELSWYHHRVAANSPDPAYYIREANAKELSVREMKDIISQDKKEGNRCKQMGDETKRKKMRKLEKTIAIGVQGQLRALSGKGMI